MRKELYDRHGTVCEPVPLKSKVVPVKTYPKPLLKVADAVNVPAILMVSLLEKVILFAPRALEIVRLLYPNAATDWAADPVY